MTAESEGVRSRAKPDSNPLTRIGGVIVGLVVLALKVEAIGHLFHDGRVYVFVVCGIGVVAALRRGRPLALVGLASVIVADALHPHPFWGTVAYAAGTWVVLALICLAGRVAARLADRGRPVIGYGWFEG